MRFFSSVYIFLIGLCFAVPVAATSVLPASLPQLATSAELIFQGKVVANEARVDDISGRVATYTTFEIIELIKGTAASRHTIKQLGGQVPGSDRIRKIHGAPSFQVGHTYVVFLPQASELGFASPLGLGQGRFLVSVRDGIATVSNGRAIEALKAPAKGAAAALQSIPGDPASASLYDFLQTVRELASD